MRPSSNNDSNKELDQDCDHKETAKFDTRNAVCDFEESDEFINVNRDSQGGNGEINDLSY